jgi:hypothetical protein
MITRFRSYIVSIIVAALFVATACFFLNSLGRYRQLNARLRHSERDLRILVRQRQEAEKKSQILAKTKAFLEKAHALGFDKTRWDTYEVEIKEGVSFSEAREMIAQTGSAGPYYFIPVYLHMTRNLPGMEAPPGAEKSRQSDDGSGEKNGDLMLDLKGTFLVRAR